MSTRVMSPPSIMDISRDISTPGSTGSLSISSSSQSASPSNSSYFRGSSSSPKTDFVRNKNVVRCLFGRPSLESSNYARGKVLEIQEQQIKKWNFDVRTEQPLDGRFRWERVGAGATTDAINSTASVPISYSLSRMPFLSSHSATSTTIQEDHESLFMVMPKGASSTSSPCPPPTPRKSTSETPEPSSPERLQQQVSSNPSTSSLSSQSSPECSSSDTLIRNPVNCIPSPPSSLEESSSPPQSPSTEGNRNNSKEISSTTVIQSSPASSQPLITQYMGQRKRTNQAAATTSTGKKKKEAAL